MSSKHPSLEGNQDVRLLYRYNRRGVGTVLKQMNSSHGIIVNRTLMKVFQDQGFEFNPEVDNKSVYSPEAMFEALGRYQVPKTEYDSASMAQAISLAEKAFGGTGDLVPLKSLSDFYASIKAEKSSGAPLFKQKGEAFEQDLRRMYRIRRGDTAAPPCVAYHRVQHGDTGPKTRLVWGYPQSVTLLEAEYARPLIDRFLEQRTPMTFGLHKASIGSRIVEMSNYGSLVGLDFSKFDSTIPVFLLYKAFDILKSHFKSVDQSAWDIMVRYFIYTPILMPDGNVYRKSNGVPSGSYFTQLVDSIVNFIVIQYANIRVTGSCVPRRRLQVLGDDSLFSVSFSPSIAPFASAAEEVGMNVNVSKSGVYPQGTPPEYLGAIWVDGVPNRQIDDIVKRIIFPERPSQSFSSGDVFTESMARVASFLSTGDNVYRDLRAMGLFGRGIRWGIPASTRRLPYATHGAEELRSVLGKPFLSAERSAKVGALL